MIGEFQGENRYLSNFWYTPVMNLHDNDGITYRSVEHAYQAAKSSDWTDRVEIANLQKPSEAKTAGNLLTLRPQWDQIKGYLMLTLVRNKFDNNQGLMDKLVSTYPHQLVEGNIWHDNTWGVCKCDTCLHDAAYEFLKPKNMLGRILQNVRFENRLRLGLDI